VLAASAAAVLGDAASAQEWRPIEPAERVSLESDSDAGVAFVLAGFVLGPDGNPAEGAVVVSSAGGRAITDAAGAYRLEVEVPSEATSVQVTAVSSAEGTLVASSSVALAGAVLTLPVDPLQLARADSCSPAWLPTFGGEPGTNDWIFALAVYDDGSGPALYAGGLFTVAGSVPSNRIARWDGSRWSALGDGIEGHASVGALAVYDDGGGSALYAGGSFTAVDGVPARYIAKWDGSRWSALGRGMDSAVEALVVYDDGGGPALYAGGYFTTAGRAFASHVAKWDGTSWSRLGGGTNGYVLALAVYDDGGGPTLCAGGLFTVAGGVPASSIARWDGSSWSNLGAGIPLPGAVQALAVHDDGGGPALFVGGNFKTAGTVPANHIAKWDGSHWSALANGMGNSDFFSVSALTVYDDGGGPALYAGGNFGNYIARWDGSSWSRPGGGVNSVVGALAVYDDGGGPALYGGGNLTMASAVPVRRIARWDGSRWSALGDGMVPHVTALAVYDDGRGPALYAGGDFTAAGGVPANRIARWDGASWSALGSGFGELVRALAVYDDGGGPALYAGGLFELAGGVPANHVAKWDGSSWSRLGSGIRGAVRALAVYDDGGGPALCAGGVFTTAGGVPANHVAKWNGSSWSALGSGMDDGVWSLTVDAAGTVDPAGGPALYAGGDFTVAGGVQANRIARWNGSSWSALGQGVSDASYAASVHALALFDDGGGSALYAGGFFGLAGGVPANHIARWDGSSWSALGSGLALITYPNTRLHSLAVHDDGSGPALYAGGYFTTAGGVAANGIARWDGSRWTPLGSGVSTGVSVPTGVKALAVFDGPERGGRALFAGGDFSRALDSGDSYLARWQGCPDTTPPVLSCPASVSVSDPRSGPPGELVTFTVTASDDRDASPSVVCVPPSGSVFPPGTTLVQCRATDDARNQASCSFEVVVQRE